MNLRPTTEILGITVVACLIAACAGTSTTEEAGLGPYSLTSTQANAVIRKSIEEGFPDKTPEALDGGRIGYHFRVWFGIDHDVVNAAAIPAGDGMYHFSVVNSGTAPVAGNPARENLLRLIEKNAAAVAEP